MSLTVSSRSRVSSWGTRPIRLLICGPSRMGSRPSTCNVPPEIGDRQAIIRIVEVLPAPLAPRNPNASPTWMSKSTASTAVKSPNRFVSRRACTAAPVLAPAPAPWPDVDTPSWPCRDGSLGPPGPWRMSASSPKRITNTTYPVPLPRPSGELRKPWPRPEPKLRRACNKLLFGVVSGQASSPSS